MISGDGVGDVDEEFACQRCTVLLHHAENGGVGKRQDDDVPGRGVAPNVPLAAPAPICAASARLGGVATHYLDGVSSLGGKAELLQMHPSQFGHSLVCSSKSQQGDETVGALGEKLFLESNTLTPILKKLEQTGYATRVRDPADEWQLRVSLTAAGRRLLENDLGEELVKACGLSDEFSVVQKNVVRLRYNLLRNTRGKQDET